MELFKNLSLEFRKNRLSLIESLRAGCLTACISIFFCMFFKELLVLPENIFYQHLSGIVLCLFAIGVIEHMPLDGYQRKVSVSSLFYGIFSWLIHSFVFVALFEYLVVFHGGQEILGKFYDPTNLKVFKANALWYSLYIAAIILVMRNFIMKFSLGHSKKYNLKRV